MILPRQELTTRRLWQGCVLSSIALALRCARDGGPEWGGIWLGPDLPSKEKEMERSWHLQLVANGVEWLERAYYRDNGSGNVGAIVFRHDEMVGAVYDHELWSSELELSSLFRGISSDLDYIVKRQLLPILTYPDISDTALVTSAFWSVGGVPQAAVDWEQMLLDGGGLFFAEMASFEEAMSALQVEHDLAPEHMELLRELWVRRIQNPIDQSVMIEPWQRQLILDTMIKPKQLRSGRELQHQECDLEVLRRMLEPLRIVVE